jgi:hypothetical protein
MVRQTNSGAGEGYDETRGRDLEQTGNIGV